MNRFPDTFQTVTDRGMFGPNVVHGTNMLTRWLTNSGCVAQVLSSLTHSSTVRQTIMSAMSQQLQSDQCVAAAKDQQTVCRVACSIASGITSSKTCLAVFAVAVVHVGPTSQQLQTYRLCSSLRCKIRSWFKVSSTSVTPFCSQKTATSTLSWLEIWSNSITPFCHKFALVGQI